MTCNLLSEKDPAESVIVTFNFSPALEVGEGITSMVSIAVEVSAGIDLNPSAIITGTALVTTDGQSIQHPIHGGLDGVNYNIKVIALTTNPEKILSVTAVLPVREQ